MLTREQNDKFRNIVNELRDFGQSLCKGGEIPFIIINVGVVSEEGVDEDELLVGNSHFYIMNTTPDIIMCQSECLAEESARYLESQQEVIRATEGKDTTDINTWIGISKGRLN